MQETTHAVVVYVTAASAEEARTLAASRSSTSARARVEKRVFVKCGVVTTCEDKGFAVLKHFRVTT